LDILFKSLLIKENKLNNLVLQNKMIKATNNADPNLVANGGVETYNFRLNLKLDGKKLQEHLTSLSQNEQNKNENETKTIDQNKSVFDELHSILKDGKSTLKDNSLRIGKINEEEEKSLALKDHRLLSNKDSLYLKSRNISPYEHALASYADEFDKQMKMNKPFTNRLSLDNFKIIGIMEKHRNRLKLLGQLANNKSETKCYVIEKFKRKYISKDQALSESIEKLRRLVQAMNHPNIVKLEYAFEQADSVCIAFEFYANATLNMLIRLNGRKPFDERQSCFFASNLLLAIEYIHKLNIVHANISTHCLYIKPNGYLMLGNFESFAKGTIPDFTQYLSPE
jgi:hypothetical protein